MGREVEDESASDVTLMGLLFALMSLKDQEDSDRNLVNAKTDSRAAHIDYLIGVLKRRLRERQATKVKGKAAAVPESEEEWMDEDSDGEEEKR